MSTKNLNTQEGLGWLWTKFKSGLSGKVDKVHGKGLSTNDFTNEEKEKLAAVTAIAYSQIDDLFKGANHNEDN